MPWDPQTSFETFYEQMLHLWASDFGDSMRSMWLATKRMLLGDGWAWYDPDDDTQIQISCKHM